MPDTPTTTVNGTKMPKATIRWIIKLIIIIVIIIIIIVINSNNHKKPNVKISQLCRHKKERVFFKHGYNATPQGLRIKDCSILVIIGLIMS